MPIPADSTAPPSPDAWLTGLDAAHRAANAGTLFWTLGVVLIAGLLFVLAFPTFGEGGRPPRPGRDEADEDAEVDRMTSDPAPSTHPRSDAPPSGKDVVD